MLREDARSFQGQPVYRRSAEAFDDFRRILRRSTGTHGQHGLLIVQGNVVFPDRLKHHADHVDRASICPRLLRENGANDLCHPRRTADRRRKRAGRIFSIASRKRIFLPVLARRRSLVSAAPVTEQLGDLLSRG